MSFLYPASPSATSNQACPRIYNRPKAFTLIELLACIAIIGILAAIITVGIGAVRERAQQATCASNLRQIGVALQLYVNDHNGSYPPSPSAPPAQTTPPKPPIPPENVGKVWRDYLHPYSSVPTSTDYGIWHCPSQPIYQPWQNVANYGGNSDLKYTFGKAANVPYPAKTMVAIDCNVGTGMHSMNQIAGKTTIGKWVSFVHNDRANMVFADGHVDSASTAQLTTVIVPSFKP